MTVEDTPVNDDHTPHPEEDTCDIVDQSFHEHVAKLRKKRREKGTDRSASSFSGGDSPGKAELEPTGADEGD